jgi:hypothetical protein
LSLITRHLYRLHQPQIAESRFDRNLILRFRLRCSLKSNYPLTIPASLSIRA